MAPRQTVIGGFATARPCRFGRSQGRSAVGPVPFWVRLPYGVCHRGRPGPAIQEGFAVRPGRVVRLRGLRRERDGIRTEPLAGRAGLPRDMVDLVLPRLELLNQRGGLAVCLAVPAQLTITARDAAPEPSLNDERMRDLRAAVVHGLDPAVQPVLRCRSVKLRERVIGHRLGEPGLSRPQRLSHDEAGAGRKAITPTFEPRAAKAVARTRPPA